MVLTPCLKGWAAVLASEGSPDVARSDPPASEPWLPQSQSSRVSRASEKYIIGFGVPPHMKQSDFIVLGPEIDNNSTFKKKTQI